ncbi:MAG: tripartite tricarboxylate transporter permease [Pyramidobacter sp.]|nr:tripartite tricarboxylate transporter permease [Pyramidobacter sp.]MBQ4490786.1 tripartite tricarboxylate transporter permease [Pyramidobacter sp.]MBQ8089233.1 tripartite tricarboxylate transporter permease [Pyramidobacter sp.]MBQ9422012.1 tripartite tricarboxylate transporter permease [Pyramidobacter sp.]MBR0108920.1 tripartite tricarboxylate transporter permease [Pyramidobacter sp.]
MELFTHLWAGLQNLLGIKPVLVVTAGVIVGILGGAMPGVSPSMAVAILLPFTFGMSPTMGMVMLCAIYLASNYGGSITAVMINTPGTPSAVVTAFDGYPLAKNGRPGYGLGVSLVASVWGGFVGIIILILFSAPLAKVALKFWPAEYFSLALMGLSTVSSMAGKRWVESLIAVLLGLLLNTIGLDHVNGVNRFTFDILNLFDGFSFVPALIGLFALSEVFQNVEENDYSAYKTVTDKVSVWPSVREYLSLKWSILRSGVLGTLIGIFPGAGGTIASFIAYDVEKRLSKHPEQFGQGALEGVAAAEASNSSSVGGALVPLLTLGIPGSASTAVLIGALMIHELRPGPELFTKHPDLVYTLFSSLFMANVVLYLLGTWGSRIWIKVTQVPKTVLYPMIFAFSIVGSFAVRSSVFDVGVCLGFGIVGWMLKKYHYPLSPIVLGLVLGALIETNLQMTLVMGGPALLFTRPLSATLLAITAVLLVWPVIVELREK